MSTQARITVDMDNAAFEVDNMASELARILRELADRIEDGCTECSLRDINGNRVGRFEVQS